MFRHMIGDWEIDLLNRRNLCNSITVTVLVSEKWDSFEELLLKSIQSFFLHEILVVPLNVPGLFKPPLQVVQIDLIGRCIADRGILEFAGSRFQLLLAEACVAPEKQADTAFQFTVSDNGIPFQKPDGVCVPYFIFRLGKVAANLS